MALAISDLRAPTLSLSLAQGCVPLFKSGGVQPAPIGAFSCPEIRAFTQEDVNGEKLTMKKDEKWWIFGADFFTVYAELFTVYKGHKR